MRSLRPTLRDSSEPGLDYSATYFRVMEATATARRLVHGRLHDKVAMMSNKVPA